MMRARWRSRQRPATSATLPLSRRRSIPDRSESVARGSPRCFNRPASATNLVRVERRAASVRQYLIETYGIEAGRLEHRGSGRVLLSLSGHD